MIDTGERRLRVGVLGAAQIAQAGADAHDGLAAVRALVAIERSLSLGDAVKPADVVGAV
jgi:hypothetical protein